MPNTIRNDTDELHRPLRVRRMHSLRHSLRRPPRLIRCSTRLRRTPRLSRIRSLAIKEPPCHIRLTRLLPLALLALAPALVAQSPAPDQPKYLAAAAEHRRRLRRGAAAAGAAQPERAGDGADVSARRSPTSPSSRSRCCGSPARASTRRTFGPQRDGADLLDHAEADRRRRRNRRSTVPPRREHLERQVLARRLAPVVSQHEERRHRAVGRRRGDRQREGVAGTDRDQRDDRRSVRLAEGQRHAGLRDSCPPAAARRPPSRRCRRVRTCRRTTARRRRRRPTKTCSRRRTTRTLFDVLLHEPARGDQHRDAARRRRSASRRSSRASRRRRAASTCSSRRSSGRSRISMPMNGFPQDVEVWDRARARSRRRSPIGRAREGTPLDRRRAGTARPSLARRSAGDDRLGRSARRRRSEEQGAVPRQGAVARGAVHRRSRPSSRRPSGASAASRSPTKASRCSPRSIASSRRTRTWILEPGAAAAQAVGSQAGRGVRQPGHAGHAARHRRRRGGGGRGGCGGRSCRTATSSISPATARRQKAIGRSSIA